MERTYKVYMYVWKTGHRYVGRTYEGSKRIGCIKNYESTEQAARELNILPQNIGQNCLYKRSSAGGYIWRRFGDNPPLKINVKERMTNVILGKISYNEGLKASKETREKLSASHIGKSPLQKKIDQFTLDGEFIKTWNNITSAARSLNKDHTHISQAANRIRKSAYGYKWKFN